MTGVRWEGDNRSPVLATAMPEAEVRRNRAYLTGAQAGEIPAIAVREVARGAARVT